MSFERDIGRMEGDIAALQGSVDRLGAQIESHRAFMTKELEDQTQKIDRLLEISNRGKGIVLGVVGVASFLSSVITWALGRVGH